MAGDGALVQRDHQEVGDLGLGHDVDKLREVGEWVGKVVLSEYSRTTTPARATTHLAEHAEDVRVGDCRHHSAFHRHLAHHRADLGMGLADVR
eukprot:scaffold75362_cov54-Phaeocystis_antarctica.AAC.1